MKKRARIVSGLAALAALFLAPTAEASITRASAPAREAPALTLTLAASEPSEFSLFDGTEIARALASRPAFDLISITTDDAAAVGRARFVSPSELSADELPEGPELLPITSVREQRFNLRIPPDVFSLEPLRGPPGDETSYPKTRYRVFGLLGTPILGELRGVSLELRWGSGEFRADLSSGNVGWLSQDPMGDKDSPNLYGFVGARPHERTDPLGLESPENKALREALAGELTRRQQQCPCIGAAPSVEDRAQGLQMWAAYHSYVDESLFWVKTVVEVPNAVAAMFAAKAGSTARAGQQARAPSLPEYLPPRISPPAQVASAPAPMSAPVPAFSDAPLPEGPFLVTEESSSPYARQLVDPPNIGVKNFTKKQRREILRINREMNAGAARSDRSGRVLGPGTQARKGVKRAGNEAQVDHVLPMSNGGTNSYRNAQVTALDENASKGDRPEDLSLLPRLDDKKD